MAPITNFFSGGLYNIGKNIAISAQVTKNAKAYALNADLLSRNSSLSVMANGSVAKNGLPKPSKITFDHLRQIARYDVVTRICVNIIKKEVSQANWDIVPRKGADQNEEEADKARALFMTVNNNGESLRVLLDRMLEDLLVLDAGVIEKVPNAKGEIVELSAVDGSTIRPVYDKYGRMPDDDGYVQVINGKVVARFKSDEIIYLMQNPQNDINLFGYGMSPIESILLAVQSSLNADLYNARVFSEDNVPPGILDLGGMSEEEAQNFIALWNATVIGNTQKLKFVYGGEASKRYTPFKMSNRDMQYVEYTDWLARLKLANYGLSSIDANITQDVNRATAETQLAISQSRGVLSIKRLVEEYFNREILMPAGIVNSVFQFEKFTNMEDRKKQAEIDKIYIENGVYYPEDVAKREGYEVSDEDAVFSDADYSGQTQEELVEEQEIEQEEVARSKKKKGEHFKPLYG